MPSVSLIDPDAAPQADAVLVATLSGPSGPRLARGGGVVDEALGRRLRAAFRAVGVSGRPEEVVRFPTLGRAGFPLVVAAGLGSAADPEAVRRAVGAAVRTLPATTRTLHIAIDGPVGAIAEGALFGSYEFTAYKSAPARSALRRVSIAAEPTAANRAALRRARVLADALTLTRDLVNTPPNDLYPESFAARTVERAEAAGLEVEVLAGRALTQGHYGGLLAVGAGSAHPPRLVRLRYRPARPRCRVALVGKGITFDSGGLNLKRANLTVMKSDMGGAAAVLATTLAAAALRLPVEVIATVPMAENMPSGTAYRPSDVLTTRSGKTVEVADTDAEGRLVLADAISRALEDDPDYLLETSTLTGGQLVALGPRLIGVMGQAGLRDRVAALSRLTGEAVWAMPLPDELRAGLDSPVADLTNVPGDGWASMLVGGRFLAEFLPPELPWVHLDVAGPAWNTGPARDYTPKGATGAPVRTLLAALEALGEPAGSSG